MTLANFLQSKQVATKKLQAFLMQRCYNTRLRRVSWSFWSTTRGVMRPRWPFKPNPPLFHLPKPFKLTLLIKRENATLRERKLWRKGGRGLPTKEAEPQKRAKVARTGQIRSLWTGGVTTSPRSKLGILHLC